MGTDPRTHCEVTFRRNPRHTTESCAAESTQMGIETMAEIVSVGPRATVGNTHSEMTTTFHGEGDDKFPRTGGNGKD